MEKLCTACGISKPAMEFHKDRSKADGLNAYCKTCHIARQRDYAKRPPRRPAPDGMKRCSGCKETKPVAEFHNDTRQHLGVSRYCKPCGAAKHDKWRRKNLPKMANHSKKWREANPQLAHDHKLRSLYGLPLGRYADMLAEQNGKCAICGTTAVGGRGGANGRFHVDHCHDTGAVRGLLCHDCNNGIGRFKHEPETLQKAISYLLKYR